MIKNITSSNTYLHNYYETQGQRESLETTYESKLPGRKFFFQERAKNILALLRFKKGSKFLDVGTGVGYYILHASLKNHDGTNISVDISRSYLIQAQKILNQRLNHIVNTSLIRADARKLPFQNQTFDVILCTEVIEHIPNYRKVISEISRVAKPGARIIISFPSKWSPDELIGQIKGALSFYEHINIISFKEFKLLCQKNNLKVIRTYHCCFCFQLLSRVGNHFPSFNPIIKFVEVSIRKIPLLNNLCWSTIILLEKDN